MPIRLVDRGGPARRATFARLAFVQRITSARRYSASRLIGSTARILSSIFAATTRSPFLCGSQGDPELPLDLVGAKPGIDLF